MSSDPLREAQILRSWNSNAGAWTNAVRQGEIASRRHATDQAIVTAILDHSPGRVLDIGCGEGWLARELVKHSIEVVGIDATTALIEAARQAGGADFRLLDYAQIAAGALDLKVDMAVANFSLLGHESVEKLFGNMPALLNAEGLFIVQTLHPLRVDAETTYRDGWRSGSWQGFSSAFTDPSDWYFRTLQSWTQLFIGNGFRLIELREPLDPRSQQPASLILIGQSAA